MLASVLAGLALTVPTVDCSARVEGADPVTAEERREALSESPRVRGVTFWGLRKAARADLSSERRDPFYKSGLSVRAGRSATVTVARRDRSWLSLRYGKHSGASALRFVPCAPDTPRFGDRSRTVGPETGWAGGYDVLRPGCATLLVRRAGDARPQSLRVGFGQACPE